jgi:acyl carrier protein
VADVRKYKPNNYKHMNIEEVNSRVKKVTARVLENNVSDIGDDANFVNDLGATSIQSIRLVAGFEEEFNIELDEDKSLQVQTVSAAVTFICSYLRVD